MRRRLILASAVALGLAGALAPISAALADDAANAKVVKDYVAAWNAHDAALAGSSFTDDVVYYDASVGKPVEGKDAATTGVVANFINAAPDLSWQIEGEPIVSGDKVAFEWTFSGTNTGAWADGTAAANKPFKFTGATVMQIRDGKIAHQSDYYDALGFYKQLGWI